MRMPRFKQQRHVWAALDIGSHKVCCMIAQYSEQGWLQVLGYGQHMSYGLKQGAIVQLDGVQQAVIQAVSAAEKMAGQLVDKLCVNISAGQPVCRRQITEISLTGHPITAADLVYLQEQVLDQARQKDRLILHMLPLTYQLDGVAGIQDPLGMVGERLQVQSQMIDIVPAYVKNLVSCLQQCRLSPKMVVLSPIATALASLVPDEEMLGSLVIDLGSDMTGLCLVQEGQVQFADILPVGGQAITQDIARGAGTSLAAAERIKTLYGAAITSSDQQANIGVPRLGDQGQTEQRYLSPAQLTEIISARVIEIFEMVQRCLTDQSIDMQSVQGIVLTGGGAHLRFVTDVCRQILRKETRLAGPRLDEMVHAPVAFGTRASEKRMPSTNDTDKTDFPDFLKSGQWACCIGLLKYAHKFGNGLSQEPCADKKTPEMMPAILLDETHRQTCQKVSEQDQSKQLGHCQMVFRSLITSSPGKQNIVTRVGGWLKQNF